MNFDFTDDQRSIKSTAKEFLAARYKPEKLRELWNPAAEAWFPDGPEDPNVGVLKFTASGGEYWDTPGGRIATVFSFIKSKVSGEPIEGDSGKVEL